MSEIRRMPRSEFERPKRRVSYPVYFVCVLVVGLLWLWLEDAGDLHWSTGVVGVFGLTYIGKGLARFIADEWAITKASRALRK